MEPVKISTVVDVMTDAQGFDGYHRHTFYVGKQTSFVHWRQGSCFGYLGNALSRAKFVGCPLVAWHFEPHVRRTAQLRKKDHIDYILSDLFPFKDVILFIEKQGYDIRDWGAHRLFPLPVSVFAKYEKAVVIAMMMLIRARFFYDLTPRVLLDQMIRTNRFDFPKREYSVPYSCLAKWSDIAPVLFKGAPLSKTVNLEEPILDSEHYDYAYNRGFFSPNQTMWVDSGYIVESVFTNPYPYFADFGGIGNLDRFTHNNKKHYLDPVTGFMDYDRAERDWKAARKSHIANYKTPFTTELKEKFGIETLSDLTEEMKEQLCAEL